MKLSELTKKVRILEVTTRHNVTGIFAGNYKSSFRGRGIEYEDVREYNEGDDARDIDWIITAREGRPFIKVYREERELNTFLMVDTSASLNFGTTDSLKKGYALNIAAMLAFSVLRNNDRMGALFYGGQRQSFFPLRKGKGNTLRILQQLICDFEENTGKKDDLDDTLRFLNRITKKRSVCFLITDHIPEDAEKMLALTSRRHDLVIIRVTDPLERELPTRGVFSLSDPETGEIAEVDFGNAGLRRLILSEMNEKEERFGRLVRRHGIDLLDISTGDSIFHALFSFFKRRQDRH